MTRSSVSSILLRIALCLLSPHTVGIIGAASRPSEHVKCIARDGARLEGSPEVFPYCIGMFRDGQLGQGVRGGCTQAQEGNEFR